MNTTDPADPVLTAPAGALAPDRAGKSEFAPDGSPVGAFAVLPPGPAPQLIDGVLPPSATVLDLGCGAGRIAHALADLGHRVVCVDQSEAMLAHVDESLERHLDDIEGLDLGTTFDAVLLASFLVNTPFADQRHEFLATCLRHTRVDSAVLIQRLDPELVPVAVDAESEADGVVYAMADVRHDASRFEATMSFTLHDETWQHRYAGAVLDDDELAAALAPHGLRIARYLDDQHTWVEARRT